MKQLSTLIGLSGAALILTMAQATHATPTNIIDAYIGGDDHGYGDVIGTLAKFDVHSMDVELIGNMLSVSINTNFAGRGDDGLFSGSTFSGNGIGYGDLFLSNSWNPYGAAPYLSDDASNGTDWSYAFSLDDRYTDGGTGSLYSLLGDDSDVLLSEDFLSGSTFRNGQEIAVDTTGKTAVESGIDWDVSATSINFLIDLTGTSLAGSSTIALHWGMTCGNDVIEGQYSVPEPGILALLALGLVGVGFSKRNKKA